MKITNLEKTIGNFSLEIPSMAIDENQIHGLIGHNGCGKTTLAKLILQLIPMDKGKIHYGSLEKRDMTLTSQRPYLLHDSVYENIVYPLKIRKIKPDDSKIDELLLQFGILEKKYQYARSLSSGERQKVSMIRALVFKPKLIIVDETMSNMDIESVQLFEDMILKKQNENPITWILISHQLAHIQRMCDQVHFLSEGRLVESGSSNKVLLNSNNTIIRRYMKSQMLEERI